jgi:hypothetical protein
MGGSPKWSNANSLLPPPKALPIEPVRAAVLDSDRGSVTAPMLAVLVKSNAMSMKSGGRYAGRVWGGHPIADPSWFLQMS